MKSLIALSIVALMAGSASASTSASRSQQKVAKVTKKKKHVKHKASTKVKTNAVAKKDSDVDPFAEFESSSATSSASAVQTQTMKVSESSASAILKRFSGEVGAESYGGIKGINKGTGDVETDYHAKLNYKLNDNTSASAYAEWDELNGFNGNDNSNNGGNYWQGFQDPYLGVTRTNIFKMSDGTVFHAAAKAFLPMSDDSQLRGQIAQLRIYGTFEKEISEGLSASFTINPRLFAQTKDIYQTSSGTIAATDNFRLLSVAGLRYSFNDVWAIEQELGVYQKWYRGAAEIGRVGGARSDYLYATSSVYFTPAKWLGIQAGIRQSDGATDLRSRRGRETSNGIYASDQSEYFIATTLSM